MFKGVSNWGLVLLATGFLAPLAFGGSVLTNNLPADTAIVNIDARADGAATANGDQSLWYSPFSSSGGLLEYTLQPGTYRFRVINSADATAMFPALTGNDLSEIYTAWTYNAPWITDYLVFDGAAATNNLIPQLFDGAFSNTNGPNSWSAYGSPDDAYGAAIAGGFYNLIRTSDSGGRNSTTFLRQFTFVEATTLIFAVPDYALGDNAGGVSVLISPAAPAPPLWIVRSSENVTLRWTTNSPEFVLMQTTNLASGQWSEVLSNRFTIGGKFSVTVPADFPAQFFRLYQP